MEWFQGSISEAIQSAKALKTLFVVVIHGPEDDGPSRNFLEVINDPEIGPSLKNAVAIKLQNGSVQCQQFSQLYPVVLVPSIYFIDSSNGVNIETTGGAVDKSKLKEIIQKLAPKLGQASALSSSPRCARVEQARTIIQNEVVTSEADQPATPTAGMSLQDRVDRAKNLLAKKQAERAAEAEEKEKTSEMSRREAGKSVQALKRKQEDDEIRKAADEKQKEREEQKLALQKVKEQIAQDRAERSAKFHEEKLARAEERRESERQRQVEEARAAEQLAAERGTFARVQFRMPDGSGHTKTFSADDTLETVYRYVGEEMATPFGTNFTLSTAFPTRQLDTDAKDEKLRSVGLVPSGTVLVFPKKSALRAAGSDGGLLAYFWLLLTPVTALLGLIGSIFGFGRQDESRKRSADQVASPERSSKRRSGGIRTEGNIARLSANDDDDDDETNTYNGNSTQQM